ncbi:MAG: copper amine oxidase N-terminal domain-containing protein, partial [Clostridia bacterium]|nr:copper amine oxidase N-terminal domain-containing protein [Clostridia bacterium]
MRRTRKKSISILVALTFLLSMVFVYAGPALAWTDNRVSTVPTLSDDPEIEQYLGTLTLLESDDYPQDLEGGKSFTVTFPSGVKIDDTDDPDDPNDSYTVVEYIYDYGQPDAKWQPLTKGTDWKKSGDYTLDITLPDDFGDRSRDGIRIKPVVKIDGFAGGDIEVTVDGFDSGVTSGKYVLGRVGEGDTTATVLSKPTIGETGKGGIIRITENSVNAIGDAKQEITIKLPKGFEWDTETKDPNTGKPYFAVDFMAGLSGSWQSVAQAVYVDGDYKYHVAGNGERTLTITFDPPSGRTQRGIIQITPYIVATSSADYGDVEVELSGDEVSDADLVIATYADFGVTVKADGDVEEVLAGQIDAELTKLYFKENVAGSFVPNRKIKISFPKWIKIQDVEVSGTKNINATTLKNAVKADIDGDDNEVQFVPLTSSPSGKVEFKLKFTVSIEANATGDIVAEVSGRAGVEGSAVVGKALAPVTATAGTPTQLSIGKKDQPIADITITEAKDGALMEGDLIVSLPDNIKFSGTPTVEVTAGNVELDEEGIDTANNELTIPIKSESTKPSTIKITGIKVDLDRTVPSGEVKASIKGEALVENYGDDPGQFDTSTVVKVAVANVVGPGEEKAKAVLTIGSTTMTVNGQEVAMDVAPYIDAATGRTYVPVRYVAQALGVAPENIFYDAGVVTLLKDVRAVQMTIGSKALLING